MQNFEEKDAPLPSPQPEPQESPLPPSPTAAPPVRRDTGTLKILGALPASPDNPPWNGWVALGTWAASVIFIIVFPNFLLLPYLMSRDVNFADQAAVMEFVKNDPTSVMLQIISIFPAHLLTLLLAWVVITNFRKFSFREMLGWEMNGYKVWHSFVIVAVFLALAFLLTRIFGEPKNDFQEMLKTSRAIVFPVAILATFTAPLVEEVIYRGILYSSLQRRLGVVWAVVLVTFLFGLVHVPQYSNQMVPDYPTVSLLFLLSLSLTLIRVYTQNLLPCIVLHMIFNGVQSVLLILDSILRDDKGVPPPTEAALSLFLK